MKITNKYKFIRSISVVIFFLIALFNICIAKSNSEAEMITYTVSNGETLWSIAKEYTPKNKDVRETIYEIKKINNITNSNLYQGQKIYIKKDFNKGNC